MLMCDHVQFLDQATNLRGFCANSTQGSPPVMEIRGIGIIDVMNLFGAGSVRDQSEIQLIIKLENWNPDSNYERLGLNENKKELVGVSVPQITIPVKVGRNIAIIIEVAAMNFRAKRMGYDASKKFKENLAELISDNSKEEK